MTDHSSREQAAKMTEIFLGARLEGAGNPPGLREAIEARLAGGAESIANRSKAQADQLRSPSSTRPADAYYAHEEAPEDELQAALAGARMAMALAGSMVDPVPFERDAGRALGPTAAWAIRSEASRVPRPPTRPTNLNWTLPPVPWLEVENSPWPPLEAAALTGKHQLHGADAEPARCDEPPYEGWIQIGLIERQSTFASRRSKLPGRDMLVATGLETSDGRPTGRQMPFATSRPTIWLRSHSEIVTNLNQNRARTILATTAGPVGSILRFDAEPGAPDPDHGPGLHPFLLGPRIELAALFGLRPEKPFLRLALIDDSGPALVCRQWRSFLTHDGNYQPLEPAVHGADLLLRPDLYEQWRAAIEPTRIRLGVYLDFSDPSH